MLVQADWSCNPARGDGDLPCALWADEYLIRKRQNLKLLCGCGLGMATPQRPPHNGHPYNGGTRGCLIQFDGRGRWCSRAGGATEGSLGGLPRSFGCSVFDRPVCQRGPTLRSRLPGTAPHLDLLDCDCRQVRGATGADNLIAKAFNGRACGYDRFAALAGCFAMIPRVIPLIAAPLLMVCHFGRDGLLAGLARDGPSCSCSPQVSWGLSLPWPKHLPRLTWPVWRTEHPCCPISAHSPICRAKGLGEWRLWWRENPCMRQSPWSGAFGAGSLN